MEWVLQMTNQLLGAIEEGIINEETLGQFTYGHLAAFMYVAERLENGRTRYCRIKSWIENINLQRLRKQFLVRRKIIVGFIANYSSTWIGDELYHMLEESGQFEPYVFLISNHNGQSDEMVKKEYARNIHFFKTRNMRVVQTLDLNSGIQYTWEQIGIKPQLCIWLTPWTDLFQGQFHLFHYSLDTLHTYVPYGVMIAENEEKKYVYDQYNLVLHNVTWKNFEESRIAVKMAEKYSFIGGSNAVYTGYPKMDAFYEDVYAEYDVWGTLIQKTENPNAKRIIYAPHHSIEEREPVHFSTFAFNYKFMLEFAEKYQNEAVWVFKPHPQLKYKAIRAGIFENETQWDAYEQQWNSLRNATVMTEGMYHRLFMESDAMILDSVSFLAEYLYVGKPLLMLTRNGQFYNDFGEQLMKVHYSAAGNDREAIEHFLTEIVFAENDTMKEEREQFFEENLNYVRINGKNAAANIFEQLCHGLTIGETEKDYEN